MTRDDINEKTVTGFIVADTDKFSKFLGEVTPKALSKPTPDMSLMGIPVRVSRSIPPNKIAVCDQSGIIGFFDMEPEPPEMA